MIALNKVRDKTTGEVTVDEKLDFDIANRDIILVDDIIEYLETASLKHVKF